MFHNYPDAPDEVAFLRTLHRHIMHFKVYIEVKNNARDIEFIMFKREVEKILDDYSVSKYYSCEMIANFLANKIREIHLNRHIKIEVSEDGENGVLMDFPTNKKI